MSDFKEKDTVGFGRGDFLWDEKGNHYLVVGKGDDVLEWSENGVLTHPLHNPRYGVPFIVRDGVHIPLEFRAAPDEMDEEYEQSLWDS